MNDAVLETLKKLVTRNTALYTDWRRLEGFLRDYAAEHKREVNVLVTAAREGVPAELLKVSGSAVPPLVVDRLVRRLYDTVGMDQALARWAVAGWVAALGKTVVSGHPVSPPAPLTPPVVTPLWPMHPIGIANASRVTQLTRWGTGSWQVAFSPDGRLLAVATGIGLYLYDIPALSEVRFIATDTALVSVAFAPDGRLLASGSSDKTVRLWEAPTGRLVRTLEGHTWWVESVAFAPDGRLLAPGRMTRPSGCGGLRRLRHRRHSSRRLSRCCGTWQPCGSCARWRGIPTG
jgi:ribosome assembly protein 4 (RSA4)